MKMGSEVEQLFDVCEVHHPRELKINAYFNNLSSSFKRRCQSRTAVQIDLGPQYDFPGCETPYYMTIPTSER